MEKKDLEDYLLLEKQIRALQSRIRKLEHMEEQYELDHVRGSNPEFPYQPITFHIGGYSILKDEKKRFRIRKLKEKLHKQKTEAEQKRIEVEEFIAGIADRTTQLVFTYLYLDGLTQEEAGRKIGLDRSSVSKKVDRHLQHSHNSHS